MAGLSDQTVTLTNGKKLRGKFVERCGEHRFKEVGGGDPEGKIGIVYADGKYRPVRRTSGRGGPWVEIPRSV
jgi:hypothetical protein